MSFPSVKFLMVILLFASQTVEALRPPDGHGQHPLVNSCRMVKVARGNTEHQSI